MLNRCHSVIKFITLAASSGKRNVTVWHQSVRLSVCPSATSFILTLIERAAGTQRDSPGGSTQCGQCIHFRLSLRRTDTDILVYYPVLSVFRSWVSQYTVVVNADYIDDNVDDDDDDDDGCQENHVAPDVEDLQQVVTVNLAQWKNTSSTTNNACISVIAVSQTTTSLISLSHTMILFTLSLSPFTCLSVETRLDYGRR